MLQPIMNSDMTTKIMAMLTSFLGAAILNDSLVFGVLPAEYFGYRPIVYGFIGNLLYSMIMLFTEWRASADREPDHQEMNRYGYALLLAQPFGAAFFSFVLTAVIKTMVRQGSIINVEINEGTSILIGVSSGLFFVYLIKPQFIEKVFRRYVEKKILGDDNEHTSK